MAAKEEAARDHLLHFGKCVLESGAIASRVARTRRAERTGLAVREIAAEDSESGDREGLGQRNQKRCLSVGAGTVREDQAVAVVRFWQCR